MKRIQFDDLCKTTQTALRREAINRGISLRMLLCEIAAGELIEERILQSKNIFDCTYDQTEEETIPNLPSNIRRISQAN
jgi:hypothetical protein